MNFSPTLNMIAEKVGPVGHLVFNKPAKHNATSVDMWEAIPTILDEFENDPTIRVIVVTGAGDKAFVSGADISEFDKVRATPLQIAHYDKIGEVANSRLTRCSKPTIARIRGYCIGGGLAVSLTCDIRIASDNSKFGVPAARLGLGYRAAGIKTLMDIVGPANAKEIFFTARQFTAQEAFGMAWSIGWCPMPNSTPMSTTIANGSARTRRSPCMPRSARSGSSPGSRNGRPGASRRAREAVLRVGGLCRGPDGLHGKAQAGLQGPLKEPPNMADPFPAVAEAAATGETAALFADIRDTVGVRVVNLVWRHLATLDGALPWAWAAVKPLYLEGLADRAAVSFRESMSLPDLGSLSGEQPKSVDDVLASYDHSNTVNLFALGALVAWLKGDGAPAGVPEGGPRLLPPDVTLPKLVSAEDVSPETWALVLRLNRLGDPRPIILASMYRHLAHAPAFLGELEAALTPIDTLEFIILGNRSYAYEKSRLLARAIVASKPRLADEIGASVGAFVDHAIGKMVTICRAIRVARESV